MTTNTPVEPENSADTSKSDTAQVGGNQADKLSEFEYYLLALKLAFANMPITADQEKPLDELIGGLKRAHQAALIASQINELDRINEKVWWIKNQHGENHREFKDDRILTLKASQLNIYAKGNDLAKNSPKGTSDVQ